MLIDEIIKLLRTAGPSYHDVPEDEYVEWWNRKRELLRLWDNREPAAAQEVVVGPGVRPAGGKRLCTCAVRPEEASRLIGLRHERTCPMYAQGMLATTEGTASEEVINDK